MGAAGEAGEVADRPGGGRGSACWLVSAFDFSFFPKFECGDSIVRGKKKEKKVSPASIFQ